MRLIRDGEKGGRGYVGGGKRETVYLSLHCHHQNDSCMKMGSDESHFNVSVGSDGQSHRTVSTNHNLFEEKGEPKRYRTEVLPLTNPNALPLGQTGSLTLRQKTFPVLQTMACSKKQQGEILNTLSLSKGSPLSEVHVSGMPKLHRAKTD